MDQMIVVEHRGDGRYMLGDAVGCKVWRRRSSAEQWAAQLTEERQGRAGCTGYVVRPLNIVNTTGAHVTPHGRIVLDVPCTCPARLDPTCPYHTHTA